MAQLAGDRARAVRRHGRNVTRGTGGRLDQGGRRHVVEAQAVGVTLGAVVRDARVAGGTHDVGTVVTCRGVTLGAGRIGRNVVRGLRTTAVLIGREGRRRGVTAGAVTAGRVARVVLHRPVVALRAHGGAGHHAQVRCCLVAGLTGRHRTRHGRVTCAGERRSRNVRRADVEAARVHVGRGVAARAVAVEAPERDVIARVRDDGDVGEGRRDARAVTGEAPGDALVRTGDRVRRVVTRRGVALAAGGRRRDVVRRLGGGAALVGRERRRGAVTAGAVTARRV